MTEVENNGWRRYGMEGMHDINEEEIRNLFNMIDKDKSGSLSLRVRITTRSLSGLGRCEYQGMPDAN